MAILLGVSNRLEPEGSGEFFCKVCDRRSSFVYLRKRPYVYVAFLPVLSVSEGQRIVRCRGCNMEFPESIFDEGSPLIFLASAVEQDGSVTYGIKNREMEMPIDSEWALGCWFDGLWYPVALGRRRGDRQLALFGDRGCVWLRSEYISPMDVRVGDEAFVPYLASDVGEDEEWRYHRVRSLTWDPDYRSNVVEYSNGERTVVSRSPICFQRRIRFRWSMGDRVLAYRNDNGYSPGTITQVNPRIEIRFDDGLVLPIRFRLIEPVDLLPFPTDDEVRTFYESPAGPVDGADWRGNASRLNQAIQVAGRGTTPNIDERIARGTPS